MGKKIWTEDEIEFIRVNAGLVTDKEGAEQFSRIFRKINHWNWTRQRQKLGLHRTTGVNSKLNQKRVDQKVGASPIPPKIKPTVTMSDEQKQVINDIIEQESTHVGHNYF